MYILILLISLQLSALNAGVTNPGNGSGSYTTDLPSHQHSVSKQQSLDKRVDPWSIVEDFTPAEPDVSEGFKKSGEPLSTHEFWTSVLWEFLNKSIEPDGAIAPQDWESVKYSSILYNYPLMMKLEPDGLNMIYQTMASLSAWKVDGVDYPSAEHPFWNAYTYDYRKGNADISIQVEGLKAEKTLLDSYSDWMVTVLWKNEGGTEENDYLKATFGYGFPYVYFEKDGLGSVVFNANSGTRVWYQNEGTLVLTRENFRTNYAIYAPKGTKWEITYQNDLLRYVDQIKFTLPEGKKNFTVAVLPEELNEWIVVRTDGTEGFPAGTKLTDIPMYVEGSDAAQGTAEIYGNFFGNWGGYFGDEGGYDPRTVQQSPDGYIIPQEMLDIVEKYRKHAFTVPVETTVSWEYKPETSSVTTNYKIKSEVKGSDEGLETTPLIGLMKHQWVKMPNVNAKYSYISPRGKMKVIESDQFSITLPFNGVMPNLPNGLSEGDEGQLSDYLNNVVDPSSEQAPPFLVEDTVADTYSNGKELARLAHLIPIAKQMGRDDLANQYIDILKEQLTDWLDATDAAYDRPIPEGLPANKRSEYAKKYFYYDGKWNTLIGYPASFEANTELNDHHFHYGYLIMAAATLARYDKQWAEQYGDMVNMLIKDTVNWNRDDKQFPFLRHYDPYMGHSQANGHVNFSSGANQESSSEAMNFATAVILWGAETNNKEIRDLGIFIYANENNAIQQYWFDIDKDVYPKNVWYLKQGDDGNYWVKQDFDQPTLGIVWSGKGDYSTWFGNVPLFVRGINYLPITGGSTYLSGVKPKLQKSLNILEEENQIYTNGNAPDDFKWKINNWSDIYWSALATYDPEKAYRLFNQHSDYLWEGANTPSQESGTPPVKGEKGDSKAHTFHWIANLKELGPIDTTITANTPFYVVFNGPNGRKYAAYNPTDQEISVAFSDGKVLTVPPNSEVLE